MSFLKRVCAFFLIVLMLAGCTKRQTEQAQNVSPDAAVFLNYQTAREAVAAEAEPDTGTSDIAAEMFETDDSVIALTLFGIDKNKARAKRSSKFRTDSIAVLAINADAKSCSVITIPRDTRAVVNRLNKKGEVAGTRRDKINSAFAYGQDSDKYSHRNALDAVSRLLGVKLEYYASIDMDCIAPLTEAVGGVPVTLDVSISGIGKKGETVELNADNAEKFVRKRHGITGGSDIARTKRQQQFIKSLAGQVQKMNAVSAIPRLITALGSNVKTNLSLPQMYALSRVLMEMDIQSVNFYTLPGRGKTISGKSYYVCNEKAARKLVEKVFSADGAQESETGLSN